MKLNGVEIVWIVIDTKSLFMCQYQRQFNFSECNEIVYGINSNRLFNGMMKLLIDEMCMDRLYSKWSNYKNGRHKFAHFSSADTFNRLYKMYICLDELKSNLFC